MQHACSLSEAGWESRNSSKRNLSNGRCLVTRFSGSVAHVDLRINFFRYAPVIIVGVIRDDDYAVISAHVIERHAGEMYPGTNALKSIRLTESGDLQRSESGYDILGSALIVLCVLP